MKNILIAGTVIGILLIAFSITGYVFAQDQNPPTPEYPSQPYGGGFHGRHGMMGGYQGFRGADQGTFPTQGGYLHDYMTAALSDTFGLTLEELQAKYNDGETAWSIAESLGYSAEEFNTLMVKVRTEAINQALADGVIPQEQADWMLDRMNQMHTNAFNANYGPCHGNSLSQEGVSHGPGWRWNLQPVP